MRKLVLFAVVAVAAVLSIAVSRPANASETSYLKTLKLSFVEAGALASTAKDTMYVTGKTDTARTTMIDLSDLDWDATLATGSVATGYPIANIYFVATRANNGVSDTLTFNVETYVPTIASTVCLSCKPDTVFQYNPILASSTNSAIGSIAVAYGGGSLPNNNVFSGVLVAIPNTAAAANMWGKRKFRLVIAGDVSGTTPKLSGVMGFITYLAKR